LTGYEIRSNGIETKVKLSEVLETSHTDPLSFTDESVEVGHDISEADLVVDLE